MLDERVPLMEDLFNTLNDMFTAIAQANSDEIVELTTNFIEGLMSLHDIFVDIIPKVKFPNKLTEINNNIPKLNERLLNLIQAGDIEKFDFTLNCELYPLFILWYKYFDFFIVNCIDEESMKEYTLKENEEILTLANEPKVFDTNEYKYDFSIVVLLYNNKEMTENCINSIHEYTKGCSYELITVNNGSDEETTNWINSLDHPCHTKKINLPINIGSSPGGNICMSLSYLFTEGKYLLFFSNDIIATDGYIKSLYECMESDPSIIINSPVVNELNNNQSIDVPYSKNNLQEMQEFAKGYNSYNPQKWFYRSRLFSAIACFRNYELAKLPLYASPYFCYDMFADDDASVVFRRAGYKQILCEDVFCHHYGSATIGDAQYEVMNVARKQFFDKYGYDAWSSFNTPLRVITSFDEQFDNLNILFIEPKVGDGLNHIMSVLKHKVIKDINVDIISNDERYKNDVINLCDNYFTFEEAVKSQIDKIYDYIVIDGFFEDTNLIMPYIQLIKRVAKKGATLIYSIKNQYYNYNIAKQITINDSEDYYTTYGSCYEEELINNPVSIFINQTLLETLLEKNNINVMNKTRFVGDYDVNLFNKIINFQIFAKKPTIKEKLDKAYKAKGYLYFCEIN